jgi:HAD superfamily hydrolase (TIGR01509 family)
VSDREVEFVLFDLGGVLIELGGVASLQELTEAVSDESIWHRWLTSTWVRRFERGECSESEFSTGFVDEWQLDMSPQRFLDLFRHWPIGPFPGTAELLVEVHQSVPIGCLSNTNSMHWSYQTSRWPMLGMFDFRFLSFELGLVKPDRAIFQAVADQLHVRRDHILYFDDVALNADAARSFGFRSEQVRGIDEVRTVLMDIGLLAV